MTLSRHLLVPMLVLVTLAQAASGQVKKDLKACLEAIRTNVSKVTEAGEKERWQANIDLWDLKLAQSGSIGKIAHGKMSDLLDRIKANVAKVTAAGEKERWQANIDLWRVLISKKGVLAKDDKQKLETPFAKMKANVARINEVGEKERWEANRDMWQVVIDRAMAGKK